MFSSMSINSKALNAIANRYICIPDYWERLSAIEKEEYMLLQATFSSSSCKNRRNKSNETFASIIEGIHSFVVRGDDNDYNRGLVCGVIFLNYMPKFQKDTSKDKLKKDYIAINSKQLKILLKKCKSSINGSFHQIGYELTEDFDNNPLFGDISNLDNDTPTMPAIIGKLFPEFENKYKHVRQWTIREREFTYKVTSQRRKPICYLKRNKMSQTGVRVPKRVNVNYSIFGSSKSEENLLLENVSNPTYNSQKDNDIRENELYDVAFSNPLDN